MLGTSDPTCTLCGPALERVRYFPRQLITADDMRMEQDYFRHKLRRHNRFLHGWGVVCGCNVVPKTTETQPWLVEVCPGYVVTPQGDDILINDCLLFDLQLGMPTPDPCKVVWPCPPQPAAATAPQQSIGYLAIRYVECMTRPVRVHPSGCGCDELDCEYSRVRDSFELKLLWTLPPSHQEAKKADGEWGADAKKNMGAISRLGYPVPPCPPCVDDPWVVLATLTVPKPKLDPKAKGGQTKPPITTQDISFLDRRVLYSTSAIQAMVIAHV